MNYAEFKSSRTATNLELIDFEVGISGEKEYAVVYTETGVEYKFPMENWDSAIEEGIAIEDGDVVRIPKKKVKTFDTTKLSYIQVTDLKPWSAASIKVQGK